MQAPHPLFLARTARGWSQATLARRLRDLGVKRGRRVNTGKDGVSKWENGRRPDPDTQRLLAELLAIPRFVVDERPWPDWLTDDPAQRLSWPWHPAGAVAALNSLVGDSMALDRRNLVRITGGTLTGALLAWLTADPAAAGQITSARRIGEPAVGHIESRVDQLRRMDDADGGGTVLAEVSEALTLVSAILKERSYTNAHGARLHAAAADLARQRANALFDVHGICADSTFDIALRAAQAADDPALGAHILGFWSVAAYNNQRYHDAEAMAGTALTAVRGRSAPRVEAMLTSRRGRARAHLHDPRCWEDFDRAETLLATADHQGDEDPSWAYWFDQAEILGARASSHLNLGQPAQAEKVFVQADAQFSHERVRTHALYLTRQAGAQLDQGHIDHACATAAHALDLTLTISSHRSTTPLLDLATRLSPHAGNAAVADFLDEARALAA